MNQFPGTHSQGSAETCLTLRLQKGEGLEGARPPRMIRVKERDWILMAHILLETAGATVLFRHITSFRRKLEKAMNKFRFPVLLPAALELVAQRIQF